jgi:hypothetical protein
MLQSSSDWPEDSHHFDSSQFLQGYSRNEAEIKRRIINGGMEFRQDPWSHLPDGMYNDPCLSYLSGRDHFIGTGLSLLAKGLVGRLLIHNPLHRATVYSALQSQWITSEISELEAAYQDRISLDS